MIIYFVLAVIILFAIVYDKKDADDIKAEAASAIDRYVRQTYGTQFDKFEVSDHIGEYYDYSRLTNTNRYDNYQLTYVSRYYKDLAWNGGFTIAADMDGNIVFDGYRTNYLKGCVVFSSLDYDYYRAVYKVQGTLRIKADEKEYITMADNIYLHGDFDAKGAVWSEHHSYAYSIYTGPVLDINNPPSVNELAAEYGCIELEINLAKPTLQKYRDIIILCRDCMAEKDLRYAVADIVINSKAEIGKGDKISFTYEEMHSPDFSRILTDRLADYITE